MVGIITETLHGTGPWLAQGDWDNFGSFLNSPQGRIFILVLLLIISLIPLLVVLRRLRRRGDLKRSTAFLIWLGLGSLPVILAVVFGGALTHQGDSTGVTYIVASAIPVFVGIILLATPKRKEQLPDEA